MATIKSLQELDPNGVYTYADYLTWKFDEYVELIKGKLVEISPAPSRYHQEVLGELHALMHSYFKKKQCKLYIAPLDVRLSKKKKDKEITTVVQPDLCVVCDMGKLDDKGCLGAPDLIIEVLSPGNSKKEMRQKFSIYEESGVTEYWIIQPWERTVWVYVLNEHGKYIGKQPLTEDESVTSEQFPGLSIDLKEVFL